MVYARWFAADDEDRPALLVKRGQKFDWTIVLGGTK